MMLLASEVPATGLVIKFFILRKRRRLLLWRPDKEIHEKRTQQLAYLFQRGAADMSAFAHHTEQLNG